MTTSATRNGSPESGDTGKPITGYTVLAWVIGFFAVIFVANGFFVYFALGSFPGLETSSSYRAGQEFKADVAAAAEQAARGWQVDASALRTADRTTLTVTMADRSGAPESHLTVTARLERPTETRSDRIVTLAETAPGTYTANLADVAAGRWWLEIEAKHRDAQLFRSRNAVFLAE